jgi:OOP family OmpA-OmpF porin
VIVNRWLLAAGLALTSTGVLAANDEPGFYLGGSAGNARYDISKQDMDDAANFGLVSNGGVILTRTATFDDSDTAWSLIAGFRFNRYFAVETGYVDLGNTRYRSSGTTRFFGLGTVPTSINIDIGAKGAVIAGSLAAPLGGHFDVHGQLGAFFARTTLDIGVGIGGVNTPTRLESDSQDLFAGVGLAYHFFDGLTASVDYSRYKDVGSENETGEGDVTSFRVGLTYTIPL